MTNTLAYRPLWNIGIALNSVSRGEREDGAQGRNRTTDTAIFNRMLYQLSYLGIVGISGKRGLYRGSIPACLGHLSRYPALGKSPIR